MTGQLKLALAALGEVVGLGLLAVAVTPRAARAAKLSLPQYKPGSPEQIALFEQAAEFAGLPLSWARSRGLINILSRESDGWVGIPNYSYGRNLPREDWARIWEELRQGVKSARSSATGLGQLILDNVDAYYPGGRSGIGNPLSEAVGMLRYIKARYGTPANAWRHYGVLQEGY